jgi:ribonuclease-3
LGFLVAEFLFEHFPEASEGELSRLRASIVNKSALVEIALDLNLSKFLLLGDGELKSGGRERESILADSVEAIIAAIYFDGGLTACKQLIISWCQNKIDGISPVGTQKDAKTYLQEIMQAQGLRLPQYRVVDVTGKNHQQSFLVECRVENLDEPQQGEGNSIRSAEQEAARKILIELGETN